MDVSLVKLTVLWRLKNIQSLIDCLTVALSQMSIVWPKQIKVTIYTIIHFEQKTSEIIFPKLIKNKNNEKIKSTRSSKTERNCDIIRRQNRSIPGNFCRWDMHIICSICNRVKKFFHNLNLNSYSSVIGDIVDVVPILETDAGDEMCWRQFWNVGDSFDHFRHQYPLSSNLSIGHPKDVNNIEILSSTYM